MDSNSSPDMLDRKGIRSAVYEAASSGFSHPFTRMRLDRVMEAAREQEAGADLERCSRTIGCIDLDTARRHLK